MSASSIRHHMEKLHGSIPPQTGVIGVVGGEPTTYDLRSTINFQGGDFGFGYKLTTLRENISEAYDVSKDC